jgi:small subunit ribosomal protein S5
MKKNEIKKEFENEVLDISRVERMTAGGRRLRFRTLVVIGDKKGRVGVGSAKGQDVQQAIEKATKKAQKSVVKVLTTKEGTIPHEVKAKFGAATILLKPQSEGRGLVAGGTVRTICSMAGIENISGKILGNTRNKLNNAKATIKALQSLKEVSRKKDKEKEEKK